MKHVNRCWYKWDFQKKLYYVNELNLDGKENLEGKKKIIFSCMLCKILSKLHIKKIKNNIFSSLFFKV
jgi:hypothetical protein